MKKSRLLLLLLIAAFVVGAIAGLPRLLPWALGHYRSDIAFSVPTDAKEIFLTIDDAPSQSTPGILAVLKKHEVTATFFVIADRVSSPSQLEEIVGAGHSLGNHLKTTKACSKLSQAEFQTDFDICAELIEKLLAAKFFRPPSDFGTETQIAYAHQKGYRAVMGTVFPLDHWISDPNRLNVLARWIAVRGGIIILHDGTARGLTTAQVLDRLIPELRAQGYTFGRLEKLPPSTISRASQSRGS